MSTELDNQTYEELAKENIAEQLEISSCIQIFRRSLLMSICARTEYFFINECRKIEFTINANDIKYGDLKGGEMEKCRKFLFNYHKIDLQALCGKDWNELLTIFKVRNLIVHNHGALTKENSEIALFLKYKSNLISLYRQELILQKDLLIYSIELVDRVIERYLSLPF